MKNEQTFIECKKEISSAATCITIKAVLQPDALSSANPYMFFYFTSF